MCCTCLLKMDSSGWFPCNQERRMAIQVVSNSPISTPLSFCTSSIFGSYVYETAALYKFPPSFLLSISITYCHHQLRKPPQVASDQSTSDAVGLIPRGGGGGKEAQPHISSFQQVPAIAPQGLLVHSVHLCI